MVWLSNIEFADICTWNSSAEQSKQRDAWLLRLYYSAIALTRTAYQMPSLFEFSQWLDTNNLHIYIDILQKATKRYRIEKSWLAVVQEEGLIRAINSNLEAKRQKKNEYDEQLAIHNVDDREVHERTAALEEEIRQMKQNLGQEEKKLEEEKTKYRRATEQVSEKERNVKNLETRINKTETNIATLNENIQAELNS